MAEMVSFICKECGKDFEIPMWRFRDKGKRSYCSKTCRIEAMKGEKNWGWKGGSRSKHPTKPFYWVIALEHYPQHCNRCLSENDLHVHHRDRDRSNNYYGNLEFLCRSCHSKEHNFVKNLKKDVSQNVSNINA